MLDSTINRKNLNLWKVENKEKYFKKISDKEWVEIDQEKEVHRFVFIEQLENDEVILDARDRNFFVKLNSLGGFWGGSINDISHRFIKGSWFNQINSNLN
jgi:hypothetical protein